MMIASRLRELDQQMPIGPWRECGHDRGGCQCGNVWSEPLDAAITSGLAFNRHNNNGEGWDDEQTTLTAAGIAALRNALPALANVVEAAETGAEPLYDERFRDRLLRHVLSNNEITHFIDALEAEQGHTRAALAELAEAIK